MSDVMNSRLMWVMAAVLVVAIGAAVGYKLKLQQAQTVIAQAELDSGCDLHQRACSLTIPGGGKVTFGISPQPIPVIEQLQLTVETEALDAKAITVDFAGVDMNMGVNRFSLKRKEAGVYHGNGILPVCVRNRMSWEAKVMVQTDEGVIIAPYRFDTSNR